MPRQNAQGLSGLLEIFKINEKSTKNPPYSEGMNRLRLPYRNYFLPGLMVLVSVWSIYMGAVTMFDIQDPDSENEAKSPSSRNGTANVSGRASKKAAASPSSSNLSDRNLSKYAVGSVGAAFADTVHSPVKNTVTHPGKNPAAKKTTVRPMLGTAGVGGPGSVEERDDLRGRLMEEAYRIALKSPEPWKNLIAIAREYYRRGETLAAREVLVIAEKLAVDPDEPHRTSISVREVVKTMLSMKQVEDAMEALHNISNTYERERMMAEVSAWSARNGDVRTAKNLLAMIFDPAKRDVALVAIAESEASYEGVSRAMQTVALITNQRKQDDAYQRIAMKRAAIQDYPGTEQSVIQIRDKNIKNRTSASVARLRVRSGDLATGLQMLKNIGNLSIEDASLRDLSAELAKLGRFSDSALVSSRIRDENEKSFAIETLSVEQAKVGDLGAALMNVSSIPVDSLRDRGLRKISAYTAHIGEPARARNVAIRIESKGERDKAYRAIAQAAAADGDHHVAFNTMQSISRPGEKALAMVSMARFRLRQGDERQALALLENARRAFPEIASVRSRDRINADMALVYAEGNEPGRSISLADSIVDPRQRDNAFGSLARTLAVNNDIPAAQRSLHSISVENIRVSAGDQVARVAARAVSPQQALRASRMLDPGRQRIVFLLEVSRKS